jgi:hypothetical protein
MHIHFLKRSVLLHWKWTDLISECLSSYEKPYFRIHSVIMIGSEAVSCNVKRWISGYQKLATLFQKWHVIACNTKPGSHQYVND